MKRSSHSRPLEALESVKIRRWTSSSCRSSVWKWVCTHGGCGAAVPWAVLPMQCNPPCCAAMSSTRKAQDGIKSDLNFKMPRSWLVFASWLSRFHKHHQFAVKLAICTILDDLLGLIEQQLFFFFFIFSQRWLFTPSRPLSQLIDSFMSAVGRAPASFLGSGFPSGER